VSKELVLVIGMFLNRFLQISTMFSLGLNFRTIYKTRASFKGGMISKDIDGQDMQYPIKNSRFVSSTFL
jgi:hypothetical protein